MHLVLSFLKRNEKLEAEAKSATEKFEEVSQLVVSQMSCQIADLFCRDICLVQCAR